MKTLTGYLFFSIALSFLSGRLAAQNGTIDVNENIKIIHLKDSVFIHESWNETKEFGRFSSNGLIVVKNGKAVMIDTPYDNNLTKQLYTFLADSMHIIVEKIIGCHYHPDCIGGLDFLQSKGVESYTLEVTKEKCVQFNLPIPANTFADSLNINFYGKKLECRYFGGGHTIDNIVVYIPKNKILFGGCLVKNLRSKGLGFTGDAVIDEWKPTLYKVKAAFKEVEIIIPGHGNFGGTELLDHTIMLIENLRKQNN